MQGKLIKCRCRRFRVSLGSSGDGVLIVGGPDSDGNTKEQEEKSKRDNRILAKDTWSSRTARHIIELLTERNTWIKNGHRRFIELSRACEEINVRLCLGSPINYHDILDRASTLWFFQLIDAQKFQFKLAGSITSWLPADAFAAQKGIAMSLYMGGGTQESQVRELTYVCIYRNWELLYTYSTN